MGGPSVPLRRGCLLKSCLVFASVPVSVPVSVSVYFCLSLSLSHIGRRGMAARSCGGRRRHDGARNTPPSREGLGPRLGLGLAL